MRLNPWIASAATLIIIVTGLGLATPTPPTPPRYNGPLTFWPNQCIDTMKSSRDQAVDWAKRPDLRKIVDARMQLIENLGATCVAIDTPYDAQFLPYLKVWVASARAHNLKVWFRGNFCSWEGWFNCPKGMSAQQLFTDTTAFIKHNPDLFENGDIFTPAPEAENGGPFNQVAPSGYYEYRVFLIQEEETTAAAFASIHKQVITNYSSMNGGFARRMLDAYTVNKLGDVVTIDHYIANPALMGDYINYFASTFDAKTVIGEWGAPIPQFNGTMTPQQQASFDGQLLEQMAVNARNVLAVNYWTLSNGSTAIVDPNLAPLPAYYVLKSYFQPSIVKGTIEDKLGRAVKYARIKVDGAFLAETDTHGNYSLLVPSGKATIQISSPGYFTQSRAANLAPGNNTVLNYRLAH